MYVYFFRVKLNTMGSDGKGWDRMGSAWLAAFNQSNAIRVDNMSQMHKSCEQCGGSDVTRWYTLMII